MVHLLAGGETYASVCVRLRAVSFWGETCSFVMFQNGAFIGWW
jgi:hypothetical protein